MLNTKQRYAAELMALYPDRTQGSIAEEVGVASKTIWVWKTKFPEFMDYYHTLCEKRFKEMEGLAIQELEKNVRKGNMKAIEYTLDYLGYKATNKVEAEVNTDINITVE